VLIRSERPLGGERAATPVERIARWLAEDGRTVVIQSCRGRGDSEGEFRPFADEVADGGDALRWIADQPWFDGELVLLGVGYSAFAAWAALSAASAPAGRGSSWGFGARDPYNWLHRDGVLQLEAALALAARLDGRTGYDPGALDLARAARHRPLGECDRVALRELTAYREWIAHPERDAWWPQRPALPDRAARAVRERLVRVLVPGRFISSSPRAARSAGRAPEPCSGPGVRRAAARGARAARDIAVIVHALRSSPPWRQPRATPPRSRSCAAPGREAALGRPQRANARSTRGEGKNSPAGGPPRGRAGRGSRGHVRRGSRRSGAVARRRGRGGRRRRRGSARRGGPRRRALLHERALHRGARARGPRAAHAARRRVAARRGHDRQARRGEPDGAARWLAEGIARAQPGADALEVELGAAGARLAAGTRLRIEVAGSSLPRFARPETGDRAPRVRTVFHGRARASALHFQSVDGTGPLA
jgi:hypothetical protein